MSVGTDISEPPSRLQQVRKSIDPVWLVAFVIPAVFALIDMAVATKIVAFASQALLETMPFILASVAIAAGAKASGADAFIAKAFQGRTSTMIVFAALMGALSPFCSCGVIPLIAALLAMGVPLAPVMAFWLASPIMDPSMFVLTTGVLGTEFAIAKTLAAIGLGLLGGAGIAAITRAGFLSNPLREGIGNGGCGASNIRAPKPIVWTFWQEDKRRGVFAKDGLKNLLFLGKWLTLAFVLEAIMLQYVPADFVVKAVGGDGWIPVVVATFVGVPAYLNGYAALPLVGGLVEQGMAPGAAMAFLVAGGVTSIPAAIAVFALSRFPLFLSYIVFALAGSLAAGALFGLIAV